MTDRRVTDDSLRVFLRAAFEALGMEAKDASTVAEAMAFADRRGIGSHGLALLPFYADQLERGVDPCGRPLVTSDNGGAIVVDGSNALGHVAADFGMRIAIDRAESAGVAVVSVGGSNHCGAMSAHATRALGHGMIGIVTTNAMPTMAPWGGRSRLVGMNPLAVAIPAREEAPFVLDTSFAVAARGKIVIRAQEGEGIPPGWALDKDGQATTDPIEALAGLLVPIGEAKGTGLSMVMGILSALLSGAAYGTELGTLESGAIPGRDGHFLLVLNIASFVDPNVFGARMDALIRQIRASPPVGPELVRVPGDRARELEERSVTEGIAVAASTLAGADAIAQRLHIKPLERMQGATR